jgi:hypothetical protein
MFHLSGKPKLNEHNLQGKSSVISTGFNTVDLQRLKRDINSFYVVPLSTKQWRKLHQNLFFLSKFKKKLEKIGPNIDTDLYANLFSMLELIADEHKQVEDLEARLNSILSTRDQFFTMVYKTKRIRLLPEYEIYDSIFGKPMREKGQSYKEEIIQVIQALLQRNQITYDQIREKVENMITL